MCVSPVGIQNPKGHMMWYSCGWASLSEHWVALQFRFLWKGRIIQGLVGELHCRSWRGCIVISLLKHIPVVVRVWGCIQEDRFPCMIMVLIHCPLLYSGHHNMRCPASLCGSPDPTQENLEVRIWRWVLGRLVVDESQRPILCSREVWPYTSSNTSWWGTSFCLVYAPEKLKHFREGKVVLEIPDEDPY